MIRWINKKRIGVLAVPAAFLLLILIAWANSKSIYIVAPAKNSCTQLEDLRFTVDQEVYPSRSPEITWTLEVTSERGGYYYFPPVWLQVWKDGEWYDLQMWAMYGRGGLVFPYLTGVSAGSPITEPLQLNQWSDGNLPPGRYRLVLQVHPSGPGRHEPSYVGAEFEVVKG